MKTSAWALLVTSFATVASATPLIACGGHVSSSDQNPSPSPTTTTTSTANPNPSNPDPGGPSQPGNPGGPGSPAIIVDGTVSSSAGRFTALALNGTDVYVAEVVDDPSTGSPTSATTIWRFGNDGTKTAVLASADIGNPFGMSILDTSSAESGSVTPYWIDGFTPFGALKSITNNAVTTVSSDFSGTMLFIDGTTLYGDYTSPSDSSCIAKIGGASPTCTVSNYAVPLQGGSGFRIVNGVMYALTSSSLTVLDLTSNVTTSHPFPQTLLTALGPNDSNGAAYDVDIAPDGTAYFATQIGIWKMDTAGNFSNAWGSDIVQQIAIKGDVLLALVIGPSGVSIQEYALDGTKVAQLITDDAQLDTRFAVDATNVYWLDPLGTSALHTAY